MDEDDRITMYIVVRIIECFSIAVFVFGVLWEGTEILNLSTPEFLMMYGGIGAVISELLSRLFKKKLPPQQVTKPS